MSQIAAATANKENFPPRLTHSAAAATRPATVIATAAEAALQPGTRKREPFSNCSVNAPVAVLDDYSCKSAEKKKRRISGSDSGLPGDGSDPQMCTAYALDIYSYLRLMELEPKRRPLPNYIEALQTDVTADMREILVDWLVDVVAEYKLVSDTLFLAVSHIDRYLSHNVIRRKRLQLLGVSAVLVASKYEEICPPNVEDLCFITDNSYSKQEVLEMEGEILKFLGYELGNPTAKVFLRRFLCAAGQEDDSEVHGSLDKGCNHDRLQTSDRLLEFMASYLVELTLLDYRCLGFLPSIIAASSVFLAGFTVDPHRHPWSKKLQTCSSYKPSQLRDCVLLIHNLQLNKKAALSVAIKEKYRHRIFKSVSTLHPPLEVPASYFVDVDE